MFIYALVVELVDAADSKSASRKGVWVRVPPRALKFMKNFLIAFLLSFFVSIFGCSSDSQVPVRQQPKALLCHVRGVPNACYIFTPKTFQYSVHDFGVIYYLTDDEGQETTILGMDCMIMPRDAIGDGACTE